MIEKLVISFLLGIIFGYFICMFKVIELRTKITNMRIDKLHESSKEAFLRKLRKEQEK